MPKDRQRNKILDRILLMYFSFRKMIFFTPEKINANQIIVHHHLGLGDNIVCFGLVNKLSEKYDKIYLPIKDRYADMIRYLYKDNKKIKFFEVSYSNSNFDVLMFSNKNDLPILRIGFEKQKNEPFNTWFYDQLGYDYSLSYDYFLLKNHQEKAEELYKHLIKFYNITDEKYQLVHSESYNNKFTLNINQDLDSIYVEKDSDIFKNIFFYTKVIENAKEIHCINSSFIHLVDRIAEDKPLFYHKIRHSNFFLSDKWQVVNY